MEGICVPVMCTFLLMQEPMPEKHLHRRVNSCVKLYKRATTYGFSGRVVVAIAYNESRFDSHRKSSSGAMGMLQAIPRYWCPRGKKRGCDFTGAGLKAWKHYRGYGLREGLCMYSSGMKCKSSGAARRYAKRVIKTISVVNKHNDPGACLSSGLRTLFSKLLKVFSY